MTAPDEHGEEITPSSGRPAISAGLVAAAIAAREAEMEGTEAAELARQLVPVIPDGGDLGRSMAPHLPAITSTWQTVTLWAPAGATTVAAVVVVALVPFTAPVTAYAAGLAGFGWWHCAGRPGPAASTRLAVSALRRALRINR